LPFVILLDADSGGRDLFGKLIADNIPETRIVRLETVFTGRQNDFALEDILSAEFYHEAVSAAYPANGVEQPVGENRKRTALYEDAFRATHGIGFNKRRVGEAVKKLLEKRAEDTETRANPGNLSTAIVERLTEQTAARSPGGHACQPGRTSSLGAWESRGLN
jgi:hypothetical protein